MKLPREISVKDLSMGFTLLIGHGSGGRCSPEDIHNEMLKTAHDDLFEKARYVADGLGLDLVVEEISSTDIVKEGIARFILTKLGNGDWYCAVFADNELHGPTYMKDSELPDIFTTVKAVARPPRVVH